MAVGRQRHLCNTCVPAWLLAMSLLLPAPVPVAAAAPPLHWNRSCNYTVSSVPAAAFFAKLSGSSGEPIFPLSPAYRPPDADTPVKAACFGPGERVNQTLVAAGIKMPCGYMIRPGQPVLVDYWEENACEATIKTNCYGYAISKPGWSGSYCMPGWRKDGDSIDYTDCSDAFNKVVQDGGIPVTRQQVYELAPPEQGHYIALAMWPGQDFHFFRRHHASGLWSHKRGDTFITNTYPNGTGVTDVEDPAILGAYRDFCGYFLVNPETHVLAESNWTYQQSILHRLAQARQLPNASVVVEPLPHPSYGWARLSYPYYLFGLDAAVFESGQRPLPWQSDNPASLPAVSLYIPDAPKSPDVHERAAAYDRSRRHSNSRWGSGVWPHWMSRIQHQSYVQDRDHFIRAGW